jgi:hypothetical protein
VNRFKTMGIAIAMAMALTAFGGAASASANEFKAEVLNEKLNGSLTGKNHVLSLNGETFTCSGVAFSGEMINETASQVQVTPELKNCAHNGFSGIAWAMNGCKFELVAGAYGGIGSMNIVGCSEPMTANLPTCSTKISNQMVLSSIQYKNAGSGKTRTITAVANLSGISFTRTGVGCSGPTGTFNNGTYTGEWTVKGSTAGGSQAGLEIAIPPPSHFAVEQAPATIAGTGASAMYFKNIGGNGTSCSSYSLSGSMASTGAGWLTLTPVYKGCTVGPEAVPDGFVSAGGCSYVFLFNGEFNIDGATCASNPITITRSGCITTIGPQGGLTGFSYTSSGTGKSRTVSIVGSTNPSNVTYTTTGPKCESPGTYSTGKILSPATLTATTSGGAAQGIWTQ